MNTAARTPAVSALEPPKPVGTSHESDGCTEPLMSLAYTFTIATTLKSTRTPSSVNRNTSCVRALSSMPTTQIHVIDRMNRTPSARLHQVLLARLSSPNRRNVYLAAMAARLGMMMRSATMLLQPPNQPVRGPMERVTHAKLVPQSGSARFR